VSVLHRFTGTVHTFDWEGAEAHSYQDAGTRGASGLVILSRKDGAHNFVFRYFRVEPGGWTRLEQHSHDHGVMILHGRACVRLGEREVEAGPRDLIYIAPEEEHQLRTVGDEPLGFLCVILPKDDGVQRGTG
jgi:quercetin dioxygenase-like cupin family protein